MGIEEESLQGGVTRINLSGRLDIPGVKAIEEKLSALSAAAQQAVVVDISEVSYLSSTGIRALLLNAKAVTKSGKWFAVLHPDENVAKVLNTVGLDRIIPVFETLAEALAKYQSQQH